MRMDGMNSIRIITAIADHPYLTVAAAFALAAIPTLALFLVA